MDNFDYFFKKLSFQDTGDSKRLLASELRKLTALNFYASNSSGEENSFTCAVLRKNVEAYNKVVDDTEGVNNYIDDILKAMPKKPTGSQKLWKSSLTVEKVAELLSDLPCSTTKTNVWDKKNCSNAALSEDEIRQLKSLNSKKEQTNPLKRKITETESVYFEVPKENSEPVKEKIAPKFYPKLKTNSYNKRQEEPEPEEEDEVPEEPRKPKYKPVRGFYKKAGKRVEDEDEEEVDEEPFKPWRPKYKPVQGFYKKNNKKEVDDEEVSTYKPGYYKTNNKKEVDDDDVSTYKSVQSYKKNNKEEEVEEVDEPAKVNGFKTAGDELKIQNLKKHGSAGGSKEGQYNYGTSKKSLGARKGGVFGKFQPPIIKNDGDEKEKVMNEETEVDERLKNIDPKMIEIIQNEIMELGPKISWDDIAGLEFAKNTIQEVVVWPMLRPDIFTGLRRPPRGILLFGPPGTGKTLIGKCIASQSGATFLSISASSLTSKWVGDGEKMVRALFAVARVNQPAVVFIDEIDSLLSQRSDSEHESSRRIKTEFLVQLDGVGTGDEDRTLIIGATNRPQELDEAARRRLVKRLYIPLPELHARAEIVKSLISKERNTLTEEDITSIAEMTEGYSGADMKHVCQEASLGPIRSIPPKLIKDIDTSQVRPVNITDFKSALTRVKSTVSPDDLHSYLAWDKQFGCGSI